jgi:DNA-binding NtrC family response regulator
MTSTPPSRRILLVDPDGPMRERIADALLRLGHQVLPVAQAEEAARHLARREYDAVVAALGAGPQAAVPIRALKKSAGGTPLLLLCDPDRARAAVRLLRSGVADYLLRPPDAFELRTRLERILERHELDSRISFFQDEISKKSAFRSLEARSPAMRAVLAGLARVAPIRSTVLITGESGVGKELVARAIHFNSPRRAGPLIALNCAAIPPSLIESELFGHEKGSFTGAHAKVRGKFEIAHGGTLFLDEIGEMDPATQVKLLRVLEEREFMRIGGDQVIRVDVRLIAATNADLDALVASGAFRRDLYYRLKVVTLHVPPLRDRREDLPYLVETFIDELARLNAVERKSLDAETAAALHQYDWPGNVRELKNLIESLLVSVPGPIVTVKHLPAQIQRAAPRAASPGLEAGATLAEMERELIRRTLDHTGGNRTHSAALLGIGVRTLQRKLHLYGLRVPSTRRRRRSTRRAEGG